MNLSKTLVALVAALAVIALAPVAAGCGSDDERASTAGTTSQRATGNAADARFVADMIRHHEGAIVMARFARQRAEHDEIKRLADDIVAAQESEIATMRRIAARLPARDTGDDGHAGMSDSEMGMDMDPETLETADPFDRAFIDMMVPHHEGAVAMAKDLQRHGDSPQLQRMADAIIDAQTREIAQMRRWRSAWYGARRSPAHDMEGMGHGR
jgi:uncharacterized protein (DUF305 family)